MRRHARNAAHGQKAEQRGQRAGAHQRRRAAVLQQRYAQRAADSEGAVETHADQRQHLSRARGPEQPDGPGDHADEGEGFAEAQQQSAADQGGIGDGDRQARPSRQQSCKARDGVDEKPALHANLAANAVGARPGAGAGEDGRQEGDADGEAGVDGAEPHAVHHEDGDSGQRHRDA
jgi:hypothetical protein